MLVEMTGQIELFHHIYFETPQIEKDVGVYKRG